MVFRRELIHIRKQHHREQNTNQIQRPVAIYKRKGLIFLGGLRISSENCLEKFLQEHSFVQKSAAKLLPDK